MSQVGFLDPFTDYVTVVWAPVTSWPQGPICTWEVGRMMPKAHPVLRVKDSGPLSEKSKKMSTFAASMALLLSHPHGELLP